jgi:hypothetical protein
MAAFAVTINGRFWLTPEDAGRPSWMRNPKIAAKNPD